MSKSIIRSVKAGFIMIAVCLTISILVGSGSAKADAATKAEYSKVKVDKTKKYKKLKAEMYYEKIVLKGSSAAVKKINKVLAADCNNFMSNKNVNSFRATAKMDSSRNDTYKNYIKTDVTYNEKGVVSIKITSIWYAGGVYNEGVSGVTFNLNTGKQLNLVNVCGNSPAKVKSKVVAAVKTKEGTTSGIDYTKVKSYKPKNYDFYLTASGKAAVCFAPYEIGQGGVSSLYNIATKYSK